MQTSESIKSIMPALLKAQEQMPSPNFDASGQYGKYSTLKELMRVARPALNEQGILISQPPAGHDVQSACFSVETRLTHAESGEYVSCTVEIPLQKATAHGVGSGITYGRRYGLGGLCGIVADEDDDGNRADVEGRQQPKQRETPKPTENTIRQKALDAIEGWTDAKPEQMGDVAADVVRRALNLPKDEPPKKLNDKQWEQVLEYVEKKSYDLVQYADVVAADENTTKKG